MKMCLNLINDGNCSVQQVQLKNKFMQLKMVPGLSGVEHAEKVPSQ